MARDNPVYMASPTTIRGKTVNPSPCLSWKFARSGNCPTCNLRKPVIHELAHVKVGVGHGHDKTWREACGDLGLRIAHATSDGRFYLARFTPDVRFQIAALTSGKTIRIASTLGNAKLEDGVVLGLNCYRPRG